MPTSGPASTSSTPARPATSSTPSGQARRRPRADPARLPRRDRRSSSPTAAARRSSTPVGGFADDRPYAYQEIGGRRPDVPVAYAIAGGLGRLRLPMSGPTTGPPARARSRRASFTRVHRRHGRRHRVRHRHRRGGNAYVVGHDRVPGPSFPGGLGPDLTYNGGDSATPSSPRSTPTAPGSSTPATSVAPEPTRPPASPSTRPATPTWRADQLRPDDLPGGVGPTDLQRRRRRLRGQGQADGTGLVYAGYIGGAGDRSGHRHRRERGRQRLRRRDAPIPTRRPSRWRSDPSTIYNGGGRRLRRQGQRRRDRLRLRGLHRRLGARRSAPASPSTRPGSAYVTGRHQSDQTTFPVKVGPDLTFNGGVRRLRGQGQG